ncbi:MAG: glycerophosphodiester phosphodiesterase family protein [Actinomycetota bacterium]|nr:glycerophosphodiester phosphodiesterase family protein [Actinomycetota bacterium]
MRAATIILTSALVLAACGGDDDVVSTTGTPAAIDSIDTDSWDVQGHRGARGLRPENTLPSFEAALDVGVSTLELDLHFSADGVVVIWHDPEIDPEKCVATDAGLPSADEEPAIRVLTADQLSAYVCNLNPSTSKYPDQVAESGEISGDAYGIATLQSLFEMVDEYANDAGKTEEQRANAATVQFNIETKRDPRNPETMGDTFDGTNPGEFEIAIVALITEWGYEDRAIVQSFDHRSLWALHTIGPSVRLAALTTDPIPDFTGLVESGAAIWSPRFSVLSATVVADAQEAGLQVIPWTVNEQNDVCSMLTMGTDGVITDRPDLVLGGWLANCG